MYHSFVFPSLFKRKFWIKKKTSSVKLTFHLMMFFFVLSYQNLFFNLGIEHSPKPYRKSEQDFLDILLTQSPHSTSSITYLRAPYSSDFEWDHLFDFTL